MRQFINVYTIGVAAGFVKRQKMGTFLFFFVKTETSPFSMPGGLSLFPLRARPARVARGFT